MKFFLCLLFFSFSVQASYPNLDFESRGDGWGFGFGFGTQTGYNHVSALDIKTPRLFEMGPFNGALVFSVESKEISGFNESTLPLHILFDLSYRPYRETIKAYFRFGAGSVLVSNPILFHQDQFFNVQGQWGVEVVTMKTQGGDYGTFFIQAVLNAPGIRNPPLNAPDIYSGTSIIVGLRTYLSL